MPGVVVTFCATPLTLIGVAPVVQAGMRTRIVHEPLTVPVTVSVVVSLDRVRGGLGDRDAALDQVSTDGTNRFTVSVVPLWK